MNQNQYLKHELIYNIYNNKFTWCETCKRHCYDGIKEDGKVYHFKEKEVKDYPKPKSHEQEVLLELITTGKASIETFFWMIGFRTRISRLTLKHGLFLARIPKSFTSKHGNVSTYYIHTLSELEKPKAVEIYYQLNNQ